MILCNGTPKTGTNLLVKAVRTFSPSMVTDGHHAHLTYTDEGERELANTYDKHIHIIRNPRSVIFSWMKFTKVELTQANIIETMKDRIDAYWKHYPWIDEPDVLTVRFEKLLTDPTELQRIGDYIEMPVADGQFKGLWGGTPTFLTDKITMKHTDWTDYWSDTLEGVWSFHGGYELENKLNYIPDKVYTDGEQ